MASEVDTISKSIDSIIQKTSALKCSEAPINLRPNKQTAESKCRLAVEVKILGECIFVRRAIKDLISNAWRLRYPWSIGSTGFHEQNLFYMIFDYEVDKRRVMDLYPWYIDGAHIMLCDSFSDVTTLQTDFSYFCFWVQAYKIPTTLQTDFSYFCFWVQAYKIPPKFL
ncbi:hypothetical protein PanWU01x14_046490 [Parasponia andersonii]|uniref:Uncharacterized protein n=1 Tax=Parasponia andersonii TaxID=3476 RepID=A0A2P5DNR8_PARAD|nr:hypothetical protein PanWU01x14_046490 [Parasponia andersonii]